MLKGKEMTEATRIKLEQLNLDEEGWIFVYNIERIIETMSEEKLEELYKVVSGNQ
jgi:hypothetical protein